MPYTPWVNVSGTWQKVTINWTEVIGGPTALSDLSEDSTSRHISDTELATFVTLSGSQTFTGIKTAQNNTSYTTFQIRNVVLSTADASGGGNGDVWIKYTP
jgi:hypothetical protein